MSAGNVDTSLMVVRSLDGLAPLFKDAVERSLAKCAEAGFDAYVYESFRTNELQEIYYGRGRPPSAEYPETVTNALTADRGWHFFGLAVDVISRAHAWGGSDSWWKSVADIFQEQGCASGYYWRMADKPHHQWGKCRVSPSQTARDLYAEGGLEAVWKAVGAME